MRAELAKTMKDTALVHVDANELHCDGGKLLPYPFTLGVVNLKTGKHKIWMPAAYTPRGYRKATDRFIDDHKAEIFAQVGVARPAPRPSKLRQALLRANEASMPAIMRAVEAALDKGGTSAGAVQVGGHVYIWEMFGDRVEIRNTAQKVLFSAHIIKR